MIKESVNKDNILALVFNRLPKRNQVSGDTSYYLEMLKYLPCQVKTYLIDIDNLNIFLFSKGEIILIEPSGIKFGNVLGILISLKDFILKLHHNKSFISLKYYLKTSLLFLKYLDFVNKNNFVLTIYQHWYLAASTTLFPHKDFSFLISQTHVPDHLVYKASKFEMNHRRILINQSFVRNILMGFNLTNDYKYSISLPDRLSYFNINDYAYDCKKSITPYARQTTSFTISPIDFSSFSFSSIDNIGSSLAYQNKEISIFFLGNHFWPPNSHALRSLVQIKYLFELITDLPININVYGKCPQSLKKQFASLNFHGYINELKLLDKYDFFVNPVRIGGGIRTKNNFILKNTHAKLLIHKTCKDNLIESDRVFFFSDALHCVEQIIKLKFDLSKTPNFFPMLDKYL